MIEFIFIFQFINMIVVDIDKSNHECDIIFAKRMFFVEDDLACLWEKYVSKIQDNKKNTLLIWIISVWIYNENKIILHDEILEFRSFIIEKIRENDFEIASTCFRRGIESIKASRRDRFIEIIEEIE